MSAPYVPPPLPFGWSEHLSPTGQPYYFNVNTKESTYVRPLPPPMAQPVVKKKKEKPLVKTPIPGTDWLRVKTTEGNIFYSHKIKKESIWHVPDEIKEAVEALEKQEREEKEKEAEATASADVHREIDRIKNEVADAVKRKAEEPVPVDEIVISKKAKIEDESDDENEPEEDWEKEGGSTTRCRGGGGKETGRGRGKAIERGRRGRKPEAAGCQAYHAESSGFIGRGGKSIVQGKEKDINPLHPWDVALPKFVSDPRYVLLQSVSARREAFDEYCRDRAREIRQANLKKEKEALDPKEEFERFLKEEVKSTRTSWSDFRRIWKKDRRFYGWGRDDREREKSFGNGFFVDFEQEKRAAALKAETDFFALLKERGVGKEGSIWKEVKRDLTDDPRYDAVGSSSLREELFNTFLKGKTTGTAAAVEESSKANDAEQTEESYEEQQKKRRERAQQAVKEREEKVRADLVRVEAEIGRSRQLGDREEGEMLFKSMLTDAIRDPQVTWDAVVPMLSVDPRFRNSPLSVNMQINLFHAHIAHLRAKHVTGLNALFEAHAPSLATTFDSLPLESLLSAIPVTKLGLDIRSLEHEFEKWQRERTTASRTAFDEMLAENSFVEFWGKLKKIGGEGVDGGVKADEGENEDEGEGGGGKVDMKVLAKGVDVEEVEKVLKNDKRYIMFDHVPDQRERWIRTYLSQLSAPQMSVHIPK
ncbi:Transcription elongation regulator 1 [Mycena sanguinolenta]|uniref:Transcription elongation regulator 1 n=1 Tax=Mycena sanguinolenta TaxID=230812 RepID=A0A8H6YBZ7_9AGAR|nr:Transcription elongation regulator 1 [Mycena sanguinolenta]